MFEDYVDREEYIECVSVYFLGIWMKKVWINFIIFD